MAKTYYFAVYRKLSARSIEMELTDIIGANDHAAGIQKHCREVAYGQSPMHVCKKDNPRRNYYCCAGWDLCIRQATADEMEHWRLVKRNRYYKALAQNWDNDTCQIIRQLAVAAGVQELSVSETDNYLAQQTAAQLVFDFSRMTGGPIIPGGPEATKTTGVLTT